MEIQIRHLNFFWKLLLNIIFDDRTSLRLDFKIHFKFFNQWKWIIIIFNDKFFKLLYDG